MAKIGSCGGCLCGWLVGRVDVASGRDGGRLVKARRPFLAACPECSHYHSVARTLAGVRPDFPAVSDYPPPPSWEEMLSAGKCTAEEAATAQATR